MSEGRGEGKHFCDLLSVSIQGNQLRNTLIVFVSTSSVEDCGLLDPCSYCAYSNSGLHFVYLSSGILCKYKAIILTLSFYLSLVELHLCLSPKWLEFLRACNRMDEIIHNINEQIKKKMLSPHMHKVTRPTSSRQTFRFRRGFCFLTLLKGLRSNGGSPNDNK